MKRKFRVIMFISIFVMLLLSCPDASDVIDNPSTGGTQTVDEETTEDDAAGAALIILGVTDSAGSDPGVQYEEVPPASEKYIYTGYDISGFSLNTAGYQEMSGTLTYTETYAGYELEYDFNLTGGPVSEVSFSASYDNDFNPPPTITVAVDSVDYTISYPTVPDPAVAPWLTVEGCGITWDTSTFASILTPPDWDLPMPDESKDAVIASTQSAYVGCILPPGAYSCDGEDFQYRVVDCSADASSSGNGGAALSVSSRLDVDGFRGTCSDVEYEALGYVGLHYVYFTAESDNPDTERIQVRFPISSVAHLKCSANEHALASVSLTANATIARMGWDEEHGEDVWTEDEYVWGAFDASIGQAVLCDDGINASRALGIFAGDVSGAPSAADVDGSIVAECELAPETEMMRLCLSLAAHSSVEFTGMLTSDKGTGEAKCYDAELKLDDSYTAVDPDNPGANITVNFYVPEF